MSCLSQAQINLVPNPSFEDTTSCPFTQDRIYYASPWFQPSIQLGNTTNSSSSDLFNSCSSSTLFGVPINALGSQSPKTGYGYAGIIVGSPISNYREYIETRLFLSLLAGEIYCIEFYVAQADSTQIAITNFGAYFSQDSLLTKSLYVIDSVIPQIKNPDTNYLTDKNNWMLISGKFIATGGEKFITIGNFDNDANTNKQTVTGNRPDSYYYIDDVSVIHLNADAGKDTAICKGESILLGRTASPGLIYNWQPDVSLSSTTIAQPIATPTVTTTYYLTATLAGGCEKFDTVTVIVTEANAGNDTVICEGSSVTLGTPALSGIDFNWQPATGLNNSSIAQPIASPANTTTYTVTATANGCTQTDEVIVTVLPYQSPLTDAGLDQTICPGDTVSIGASATAGYAYSWSTFINLSDTNNSQPFAFPDQTTLYKLTVMDIASNYLCKTNGTDSVLITVDECPPEIPNVFTPNGDGINDEFVINDLPANSIVTIYNRWGIKIFQLATNNQQPTTVQWDGRTTAGLESPGGVYYYIVSIPEGKNYAGFVMLLK